jgi:hypothetical protein
MLMAPGDAFTIELYLAVFYNFRKHPRASVSVTNIPLYPLHYYSADRDGAPALVVANYSHF